MFFGQPGPTDAISTSEPRTLPVRENATRWVLALSEDGYNFDKTFILSDDRYTQQYKGRWKGGDYGYPYAMVHDGYIYVIVSRRKERIEIIRIEIDALQ